MSCDASIVFTAITVLQIGLFGVVKLRGNTGTLYDPSVYNLQQTSFRHNEILFILTELCRLTIS